MICNLEPEMFTFSRWNFATVWCMCTFPGVGGKVLQQPIMSFEQHNFWCLHGNHILYKTAEAVTTVVQVRIIVSCLQCCSTECFHFVRQKARVLFMFFNADVVSWSFRPSTSGRKEILNYDTTFFLPLHKAGLKRYQQSTDTSSWNPFEIDRYYFRIPRE